MKNKIPISIRSSLENAIRQECMQMVYYGAVFLSASLLVVWGLGELGLAIYLLAFVLLTMSGALFYTAVKKRNWEKHDFTHCLCSNPKSVVWAYSMLIQLMPFGLAVKEKARIVLKTKDKEEWTIDLPQEDLNEVMLLLNKLLPQATFGYSVDKQQWYTAEPHLLYRDEPPNTTSYRDVNS